tara:strand:- start:2421 stop:2957 length:537 start_codon:yes stop_codon:yes gene_type:complete
MIRLLQLLLLLACLYSVSNSANAEETDVIASPNAVGNSSIINQNLNINNGMTGKQQFGNLVCSQPTMSVTPFYTGNDAQGDETYSINEGWGIQMSFMVPLGKTNTTCQNLAKVKLNLAKEQLDKQVHDKQLVRVLKCSQLHASGYMINPKSKFASLCSDVINIRSYVKANPDIFKTKE